jgi:hypothetical protein
MVNLQQEANPMKPITTASARKKALAAILELRDLHEVADGELQEHLLRAALHLDDALEEFDAVDEAKRREWWGEALTAA